MKSNAIIITKLILFWKPVIWLALICYGLFLPANDLPMKPFLMIPYFDKMVHFLLFFMLCLLFFRPFKSLQLRQYLWASLLTLALSALLELSQHIFTSTRNSDIYDFIANISGIFVALLFYHFLISGRKWENLF